MRGLRALGWLRIVATVTISMPFSYSSGGYMLMSSTMMMTCGSLVLRGSRPRMPAPRVTIEADVAVLLVVGLDRAGDGLGHLLAAERDFQLDVPGALVEPVDVLAEAEDLAVVNADAFEDAVAVEQAVIVDADLGVGFVVELAVDVDLGSCPMAFTRADEMARVHWPACRHLKPAVLSAGVQGRGRYSSLPDTFAACGAGCSTPPGDQRTTRSVSATMSRL